MAVFSHHGLCGRSQPPHIGCTYTRVLWEPPHADRHVVVGGTAEAVVSVAQPHWEKTLGRRRGPPRHFAFDLIQMNPFYCPCCAGRRVQQWRLSEINFEAEEAFCSAVGKLVADLMHQTVQQVSDPCAVIRALDGEVQTGRVRRPAAAQAASRMRPAGTMFAEYASNLLRALLWQGTRTLGHDLTAQGCSCLHTVLAWGTCPTIVLPVLWTWRPTAIGLVAVADRRFQDHCMSVLFSYGSVPWMYSKDRGGRAAFAGPLTNTSPAQQWARWHGRRFRKLWLSSLCA
jgi:hypothetical protein